MHSPPPRTRIISGVLRSGEEQAAPLPEVRQRRISVGKQKGRDYAAKSDCWGAEGFASYLAQLALSAGEKRDFWRFYLPLQKSEKKISFPPKTPRAGRFTFSRCVTKKNETRIFLRDIILSCRMESKLGLSGLAEAKKASVGQRPSGL